MVIRTGKLEIGSQSTIKTLKHGKSKMVVIASNADPSVKKDIEYYAKLSQTPIYVFQGTSVELGTLLGKPFPIQALSIIDVGDSKILELVET
ncbi:ribosomal protein L7Ae/L30e/S12e/Gadd45 [Fervidicoccus fontis Kam940]|uniref:Large ribosomal subunit protein eL30 n=2 Tax=Fervidicoccus fontis TaxID=683846 RepID=I0A0T2_FERFK|nr:ribosomal protein L7Ae/L30e/S12e/Gadd45 [Fervidicoccus fontis Kam940]